MAAAVVPPASTSNQTNLEKIESFINDSSYKEILENSVNYNTRLCIERRLRLPFIDTQTGVAQNHCALFMNRRQRIPGLLPGQIYTYPRQRWRKKRRQYLTMHSRGFHRASDVLDGDIDMHSISQIENPALQDTDSKDSQLLKDDVAKEWFYDEQDMLEIDPYDEPDPDSDLDYEETYKRSKRRKGVGRGRGGVDSPSTPGRRKGPGRGRKKAAHNFDPTPGDPDKPFACELCGARYKTRPGLTYHYGHSHKEGASDDNSRDSTAAASAAPPTAPQQQPPPPPPNMMVGGIGGPPPLMGGPPMGPGGPVGVGGQPPPPNMMGGGGIVQPPPMPPLVDGQPPNLNPNPLGPPVYQDSYVSFLNASPPGTPGRRGRHPNPQGMPPGPGQMPPGMPPMPPGGPPPGHPGHPLQAPPNLPPNLPPQQPPMIMDDPTMPVLMPEKSLVDLPPHPPMMMMGEPPMEKKNAAPSPYCDFCLGDTNQNKKTGGMEELVSCSDCGRSGHPSCLQFTANMKISVKKYRWQCIECKCCSMCGNSDNDDQLLFCDDCDRGYHMYCLSPPLVNPPEGSWSCNLCIEQFHK
ncbi:unnamed protein product [Brassicogethes aeneus]|uniref:Zinc finger protein ubi-d4 n=1 Tax=Brassicogethes aeneus TaxID=1431903 RepID=A0A9P0FAA1_BRAAE|nr:unnamed protein product [Brassicogethes aeneus]